MIHADLRNSDGSIYWPIGALGNISEGCAALPGDTCDCGDCHSDPTPGCKRVILSRWPVDGECGPFGYDEKTGEPVQNAEATKKAAEREAAAKAEAEIQAELRVYLAERIAAR